MDMRTGRTPTAQYGSAYAGGYSGGYTGGYPGHYADRFDAPLQDARQPPDLKGSPQTWDPSHPGFAASDRDARQLRQRPMSHEDQRVMQSQLTLLKRKIDRRGGASGLGSRGRVAAR